MSQQYNLIGVVIALIIYTIAGNIIEHHKLKYVHESGIAIGIGLVLGIISITIDYQQSKFDETVFFYGLLPPILFSAGYSLKKGNFFRNFAPISLLGIIGTILNFVLLYLLTYQININDLIVGLNGEIIRLSTEEILLFASVICSTDTVAALTLISKDKKPQLFSIIFGEGLVNDTIALVLNKSVYILSGTNDSLDLSSYNMFKLFLQVTYVSLASIVLGITCGCICTLIFKHIRSLSSSSVSQITLVLFHGYLAYLLGECSQISGVLAMLVSAVIMNHYSYYNMANFAQKGINVTLMSFSHVCEGFLFLYMGYTCLVEREVISVAFIGYELLIVMFSRFITVFFIRFILFLMNHPSQIGIYDLIIISFSGMIRGAIAFALIVDHDSQHARVLKSTVVFLVISTTLVLGALLGKIIQVLNDCQKEQDQNILVQPLIENSQYKPTVKGFWNKIDEKYLKPFFIFDYQNLKIQRLKQQKSKNETNQDISCTVSKFDMNQHFDISQQEQISQRYEHVQISSTPTFNDKQNEILSQSVKETSQKLYQPLQTNGTFAFDYQDKLKQEKLEELDINQKIVPFIFDSQILEQNDEQTSRSMSQNFDKSHNQDL